MDSVDFTPQDIPALRRAAKFLRRTELELPDTAHQLTHDAILLSALRLDDQADEQGRQAPNSTVRETRRPIFNHLVAPAAGGPVHHEQAKAMLDAHESNVRAATLAAVAAAPLSHVTLELLAGMRAEDLDAFVDAIDDVRTMVRDVHDQRSPRTSCGGFYDHAGHTWTLYGRPRYCWGTGPFLDSSAYGKCGAKWPHPAHEMGRAYQPCAGMSAEPEQAKTTPSGCPRNVIDGDVGGHFFKHGAFVDGPRRCVYCAAPEPEASSE
ncbi:hypothetical protein ACFVFT_38610 [Streptomyces tendae]|uniref:hypothetical protein n=1 Tax=Streptomyces tendae TaxID=1932 RepID=UPI00367AD6E7